MVEQLLMRGTYRRRIVDFSNHARSYLIDVDLVRGTASDLFLLIFEQLFRYFCMSNIPKSIGYFFVLPAACLESIFLEYTSKKIDSRQAALN